MGRVDVRRDRAHRGSHGHSLPCSPATGTGSAPAPFSRNAASAARECPRTASRSTTSAPSAVRTRSPSATTTSSAATACPSRSSPRPRQGRPWIKNRAFRASSTRISTPSIFLTQAASAFQPALPASASRSPRLCAGDSIRRRRRLLVQRLYPSVPDHERAGRTCLARHVAA